jgi:2-polyprenyl-6-methoxyphenol hydroxylase-like FAD-dependent oxidoreductase
MSDRRRALVVGAGIGGLATAVALRRAGLEVSVLERAPELTEVGAGLSLWPNALRALDALGLGDQVRAAGVPQLTGGLRRPDGRWLARADTGEVSRRFGDVVMIARPELLAVLRAAAPPGVVRTGVEVIGVDQALGHVVVTHDGGSETADMLIGADGIRSLVRRLTWPEAPAPRYAGYVAYRLLTPPMPWDRDEGAETWGAGTRFGYVPLRDGRVYCFAAVSSPPQTAYAGAGSVEDLEILVGAWHAPIPELLAAARDGRSPVLLHDIEELPDLATFVSGRVALLGDAAHAMTPNLGQGACQALEDAVELAASVSVEADVPAALAAYDRRRRPRAQRIARRSRSVGRVAQWSAPPLVAVRDLVTRLTPPTAVMRGLGSVLDWEPPASARSVGGRG